MGHWHAVMAPDGTSQQTDDDDEPIGTKIMAIHTNLLTRIDPWRNTTVYLAIIVMSLYQPPQLQGLVPLLNPTQDKIHRELFGGNTPAGTSEVLLQHFVNAAMQRAGLCEPHKSPVLNSLVNSKFAFVDLESVKVANKRLNLNGIPFLTAYLKSVGLPSTLVP